MIKQDQHKHFEDDFDNFLSKQLQHSQPYLHDENFTVSVMDKLPAGKKLSRLQERLIIIVPLIVISLLVLSQFSIFAVLVKLWAFMLGANVASLLQIGLVITIAVISGASIWFAKQFKLI